MDLTVNMTGHSIKLIANVAEGKEAGHSEGQEHLSKEKESMPGNSISKGVQSLSSKDSKSRQSLRRKAAEMALASIYHDAPSIKKPKFSSPRGESSNPTVALSLSACDSECSCQRQQSNARTSTSERWCTFGVKIPHTDWKSVIDSAAGFLPVKDAETGCKTYRLEEGVRVIVVDTAKAVGPALLQLRHSMQDPVISIDLEWKPERGRDKHHKVALIQLASSTMALLIRTSNLDFKLGHALEQFLRDPSIVVVGFSWDSSDEKKFNQSFQLGRSIMRKFVDLQNVGAMLGYRGYGLGTLSQQVMGLQMRKSKKITLSNWEARRLGPQQVMYAAMDALIAGAVFRALRLWHSLPSDCSMCRVSLGAPVQMSNPPSADSNSDSEHSTIKSIGLNIHPGLCKCISCGRQTSKVWAGS